jgi:hypothetical protein
MPLNKFIDNLTKQASEQPLVAVGIGAAFLQAASKFLNANAARNNSKTYKKEIDRRVKKSQKS